MSSNQVTLAFANDTEISAIGFESLGDAVSYYSEAATKGFTQCRFVSFGLSDCIEGLDDDDYVLIVTGVIKLRAFVGKFGSRPPDLRGWIVFSNCNYFLESLDLVFGQTGGYVIPVDQFMCGSDGKPVLQRGDWSFMDYFEDNDQVSISGLIYVKAWETQRLELPYELQNLAAITSITYLADFRHQLVDGTTMKTAMKPKLRSSVVLDEKFKQLYAEFGSPFVGNGVDLLGVVGKPCFLHALVKCTCGNTHWTVGDWEGYISTCCAIQCKPMMIVTHDVGPGDVVITRAKPRSAAIKYYNHMFLRHVALVENVNVWRVVKLQSRDGLACSGNVDALHDVGVMDDCHYSNNTLLASELKLCLLSGCFTDKVKAAIVAGHVTVGSQHVDVLDDIMGLPWFIRKLGDLALSAWESLKIAIRSLKLGTDQLILFAKNLSTAAVRVAKGAFQFVVDVPPSFVKVFDTFLAAINTLFANAVEHLKIGAHNFARVGEFVCFDSALVKLMPTKVRGKKQCGIDRVFYTNALFGQTHKVKSSHVEKCDINLTLFDQQVPVFDKGKTVVVGDMAFFESDGFYRFMSDADSVLEEPVFRSAFEQEPVFECIKPKGFVIPAASNLVELCVRLENALRPFSNSYRTYSTIIRDDRCVVKCTTAFVAPDCLADKQRFVEQCAVMMGHDDFDDFYAAACEAVELQQFVALCKGDFACFIPSLPECPSLFDIIDGGVIWRNLVAGVEAVADFCRHLSVSFGLDGVVVRSAKRFKKIATVLAQAYNTFLDTVVSSLKLAGVSFKSFATNVPSVVLNGCLHCVKRVVSSALNIPCEGGVDSFNAFDQCPVPVQPQRVEITCVELEEVDYVEPGTRGVLTIVDGHAFYCDGEHYFPSSGTAVAPVCFKKRGGGSVSFAEKLDVKIIEPVYKVDLEFEFESETIVKVLTKAVGTRVKINGGWDQLLEYIGTAVQAMKEHIEVPQYYVYDQEGGTDITLPVMISEWPVAEEEDVQQCSIDFEENQQELSVEDALNALDSAIDAGERLTLSDTSDIVQSLDDSEVAQVNEALSFIVEKPIDYQPDIFSCQFVSYGGLKVLNQQNNNCWVSSTLVQLQLLDILQGDNAFQLFKAGRVSPMVKKCYESLSAIIGSLGDVSACIEKLTKELETLQVCCDTSCGCGPSERYYLGCALRMTPTSEPFSYGVCSVCKEALVHTFKSIKGTGIFCRDPTPLDVNTLVVKPICASVFVGGDVGHYLTNLYGCDMAVDGFGKHPIKYDTMNTICVKDVDWEKQSTAITSVVDVARPCADQCAITPFATYRNVKFYRGDITELLKLKFDFVVNAANEKLAHGGGIAKALDDYTKGELQKLSNHYIKKNGALKVGTGVMLEPAGLSIYNVVGPRNGKHASSLLLKAYKAVFANDGIPLLPLLSVGIFKVPITVSMEALLATVGDRDCVCFCYGAEEQVAIQECVAAMVDNSDASDLIVQHVSQQVFEPYRVEGSVSFYRAEVEHFGALGVEKIVFFTSPQLDMCDTAKAFDAHCKGALSVAIDTYKQHTPVVPAGNCVVLKCDGFLTVVLVVLPIQGPNYEKNYKRATSKFAKLKGKLLVACEDPTLFKNIAHVPVVGFITQPDNAAKFYPAVCVVPVTEDSRNVMLRELDATKTYGEQLGDCVLEGKVVTNTKPVDVATVVKVAPKIDWDKHFGFENAGCFYVLDHSNFAFDNTVVNGVRVLKTTDNNCWVNAVCLQLQYAKFKFKSKGLQDAWESYCVGDVAMFAHWLYWITGVDKGQASDAENTLNVIAKYIVPSGSVTIQTTTGDGCCNVTKTVCDPVVNASVLKLGFDDGVCSHGAAMLTRVTAVKGSVIIVNVGKPVVSMPNLFLKGRSYTSFHDNGIGVVGHYTVLDASVSMLHDGDTLRVGDLALLPVTNVVVQEFEQVIVKDPVTRIELDVTKCMNGLNYASDKFFFFGDFVSRNLIVILFYIFGILGLLFKAFKKRDFKVLAGVPQRTGIILSRSIRYNVKALRIFFKIKYQWLKMVAKVGLTLYALYALLFMIIRFSPFGGPVCDQFVQGYANSSFDKNDYCDSVVCKICLFGYQELSDFKHTNVIWQHLKEPLVVNVMPFVYLTFLTIFGGFYMRGILLYFYLQYFNVACVALGFQDLLWVLHFVPFDSFGDEIVVLFVVARVLLFVKHVLFGCDKPSCIACSKSARLTRIPVQTIFQGSSKLFYVQANGGKKFCSKHNFFCVNCDSYGQGNTFINDVIASEVSNITKTNVQPTGPATVIVDKVEFNNGFYYLYSGSVFWKYSFDITDSKYSCKDALKNCNIVSDFIVYNNTGSNVSQIKNACVYFSQLLCKPIKLVDSALLSTLSVDFGASLHSAFTGVLSNSFNKDLSHCTDLKECKQELGFSDVSDDDFRAAVTEAHRYDVLLTDLSFNNFVTSYAKPEEKFPVHDVATCMRVGAKVVNHNVCIKDNIPVVWLVRDFISLSEDIRKYIIRTTKVKGLSFMLTFNDCRMLTSVPTVCIVNKKGAGFPSLLKRFYNAYWYLCAIILLVFFSLSFLDFTTTVSSMGDYEFRYIENGQLKDFDKPLDCVHNVFDNFLQWHESKFASVPLVKHTCPIVVGVSDEVRTVPGVPSGVYLVGKTLVFAMNTIFGNSGLCFDTMGVASRETCVFNSACTILSGVGGAATYCYKHGLVEGSKLYSDLIPHATYKLVDGNSIALPEVLSRGFGVRTVKTKAMTYCRIGQCISSKAGVCFGADRFFVFNANSGPDFVCGSGLFSLFTNVFNMFSKSVPVVVLSGQIVFNCLLAFVAVAICFMFTKFKRMFGDMSYGVFTVVFCTLINNFSYIATQNTLGVVVYATVYFLSTKGVRYMWIWHLSFMTSYALLAPWWVLFVYFVSTLCEFLPNLFKLKVTAQLFDGDKFVGSFENAAGGTFVLDMHSYERLVNSITSDKLNQYAANYNKYKYYSGAASEIDYKLACFAHLAKAMKDFAVSHQDILYTPPTVNFNSSLQSGLRKMAQPSGIVEKCIVRVCYGNTTLNGLWLGDLVICPRHVIAANTNVVIDYDHALSVVRLHNFSVSCGNMYLGVIGVTMRGALLHIKVGQVNVNTPKFTYRTLRPGESFNILACYDGEASGVFGVNMRPNGTIRGSFINGACGSPGYNVVKGVVEFCYVHQLELGSGCHVGSDLDGLIYGGYEDQPTLQIEGANNLVTENVVSFLYGALINGSNWWLSADRLSSDAFNEWAQHNGMTPIYNVDGFSILAAKTSVDVQRVLASIRVLQKSFGGRQIMGFTSLTDEFTMSEVVKQMFGVTLQSGKVSRTCRNVLLVGGFLAFFWSELVAYTKFFWVNPGYVTPMFMCVSLFSTLLMFTIKHKMLFLQMFLVPALVVVSGVNLSWDFTFYKYLAKNFDYHVSMMGLNAQGIVNILVCFVVVLLHTYRFVRTSRDFVTYGFAILAACYNYFYVADNLSCFMALFASFTGNWIVGVINYRAALYGVTLWPSFVSLFGHTKSVIFCYLISGYVTCCFYGVLYWFNRFFKVAVGVYDYKVSASEFKYMVANGLRPPSGVVDSLVLSAKLVGIGGDRTIKISSVQSKLTDIKCSNVVLLGCLSSMNVASNSAEWAYCVDLHNKINLCNDPERAQELLLALLAFFLSKNSAFGLDDLLESYFNDNSVLQSVAATYVGLPSYVAYEAARQSYEDAVGNGSPPQLVKQLRHAMNVAKSEFDREASTQRKLDRMAEQAAAQMYKEARAVNRKSKVVSAMHSLLFGMLRRLDMSSVDTVLNLAKDGVVPLSIIPAVSATKLSIVAADVDSYNRIHREGCVHYAGTIWNVVDIKDNDGKTVHQKEIHAQNAEALAWPLVLNCERIVKLQNNEIIPGKLKQRAIKAEGEGFTADGKALYNTEGGKTFMYAFISDKADLKVVKWEFDGGCNAIELEQPRKFLVDTPNGPAVKYLYFVRNLNTLRRGAVLGYIGATIRLQAGKQTELATNSSLLTLCAFSVDPAKTYVEAVRSGHKPVSNCIKMLANGSGNGQAITNGVEANTNQDSYGGASVCIYCRAHVCHPSMDGVCRLKGKYVQVPIGTTDPIRYVIENKVCQACGCWYGNGCTCDRSVMQSVDTGYLNELGALVQLD